MNSTEAYVIVEKPEVALDGYLKEHQTDQGWADNYPRFRNGFQFLKPERYRGISRNPLLRFPVADIDALRKFSYYRVDVNTAARLKIFELCNNLPEDDDLDEVSMLKSLDQALEVYSLLDADQRDNYEIIQISVNAPSIEPETLGYDIGYWGSDFYSIICDSVVRPQWHGPPWEAIQSLAEHAKKLNSNLLLEQITEAVDFREYYKSKSWAETEGHEGEFAIIRIDECKRIFD